MEVDAWVGDVMAGIIMPSISTFIWFLDPKEMMVLCNYFVQYGGPVVGELICMLVMGYEIQH